MVTNSNATVFHSGNPTIPPEVLASWPKLVRPLPSRVTPDLAGSVLPDLSDSCAAKCGWHPEEQHFHFYVYMRSSSDKQMEKKTRYWQLDKCAAFLDGPVVQRQGIYFDGPCSGYAGDPQIGQDLMLRAIEADPFQSKVVFAVDVSRFTRNAERGAYLWEWGKKHNVVFQTLKQVFPYDESGERAWTREVEKAAEFSRGISRGMRVGRQQAAAEGRWDKRTPCGMQRLEGQLVLDPDVESIVRKAFLMRSQGLSVPKIANFLLSEPEWRRRYGLVKPDTHKAKVRRMLNDTKFVHFAASLSDPALLRRIRLEEGIDLDQVVQARLLKPLRADKDQVVAGDFRLSGRLKCGHCGAKLVNRAVRLVEHGCEEILVDRRAYICPKTTCQPRRIHDAEVLHAQVPPLLVEAFNTGRKNLDLSAEWANVQYGEHAAFIRHHFGMLFTVTEGTLALPKRNNER